MTRQQIAQAIAGLETSAARHESRGEEEQASTKRWMAVALAWSQGAECEYLDKLSEVIGREQREMAGRN